MTTAVDPGSAPSPLPAGADAFRPDSPAFKQAVCNAIADAIFIKDLDGRYVYVNDAWARLFSAPPAKVLGTNDDAWLGPEAGALLRARDLAVCAEDASSTHDEALAIGPARYVFSTTRAPYRDADGTIVGVIGVARDVTADRTREAAARLERVRVEVELGDERRRLAREQERFAALCDTAPGAVFVQRLDPDGRVEILYVNANVEEIYGVTTEAYLARPTEAFALIHPDDSERVGRTFRDAGVSGQLWREEFRVAHPTKGEIWVEGRARAAREPGGSLLWHGILMEVTDRKRSEAKLSASESTLRAIVETVPDYLCLIGLDRTVQYVNHVMPGHTIDGVIGTDATLFMPEGFRKEARALIRRVLETGERHDGESAVLGPDGDFRWLHARVAPVRHEGAIVALTLCSTDVTERHRELAERKKTEELLRCVLESVTDAIVTVDMRGKIVSANPATSRLFGFSPSELIGSDVGILIPMEARGLHAPALAGTPGSLITPHAQGRDVEALRKDGTMFPAEVAISRLEIGGAPHFTAVVRDVSQRKKLEDQFRQAHKMEAFGQLAGGVAHDFNNLLTIILGETEYLAATEPPDDDTMVSLAAIRDAADRAASLTQQLLAFSRKTVLEPKAVDINQVVRDTTKILRRLIGEDVHLETRLALNLEQVYVDPSQIGQVLMNLAVNARDAMPRGGALTIETSNVHVAAEADLDGPAPGAYVRVRVRDTGCGMSEEVRSRVFQPFFTTKAVGKGTGLGLAVVHGIVTQSGGAIRVDSVQGEGTTFELLLPVSESSHATIHPAAPDQVHGGSETVLLVEDDDAIRRVAMRALAAEGYRVLVARDGVEATAIMASHADEIDILVTDVVMPKMDGAELGEHLLDRYPKTKVLYVSGYTDDMLLDRGLQADEVEFLAKPYTPVALRSAVRRALARG